MGMSKRTFVCRGHEALRLVFRIRVDTLNVLAKNHGVKMFPYTLLQNLEVINTFSIINKYI